MKSLVQILSEDAAHNLDSTVGNILDLIQDIQQEKETDDRWCKIQGVGIEFCKIAMGEIPLVGGTLGALDGLWAMYEAGKNEEYAWKDIEEYPILRRMKMHPELIKVLDNMVLKEIDTKYKEYLTTLGRETKVLDIIDIDIFTKNWILDETEKSVEVTILREYVRNLLIKEVKSNEPDMTKHVDDLENLIFTFLFTQSTFNKLQTLEPGIELPAVLPTDIFDDFENVNEVHVGILVTDDNTGNIEAAYVCVPENRSTSNLVLALEIPRDYPTRDDFQDWLSEELADALSHEIQHSCDPAEMLTSDDCGDESKKWESLENIEKYYGCEAEVRGHVAGILGRARRTGKNPEDLLDTDMNTIMQKSLSHGFTQEEVIPVLQNIYNKWLNRLETIR